MLFTTACYKFCLIAFYMVAIMTILKEQGFSLSQLSWVYILGILEMLKFIISPLLERFRLNRIGHFKGWFLLSLALMSGCFIGLLFIQPQQHFSALLIICSALNFISLLFGCAALGFTCAVLPYEQRGFGGAIQVIAGRIGKMLGGGLVLVIYQHYGWQSAVGFMAVFTLLLIIQTLIYTEKTAAETSSNYRLCFLFNRLITFWQQPNTGVSWFVLLLLFCIPSSMVVNLFVPSLNDLGWSAQNIGLLLTVAEPVAVMLFTPLSGVLLKKYSRFGLIQTILFVQIFLFALFYVSRLMSDFSPFLMAAPILLLSISYGLLMPCVLAVLMDKSDPKLATLDSSLQFSVVLFGVYLASFFSLRQAEIFGYPAVYAEATLMALLLWIFVIRFKKHRFF
ncbi:MFS transporter [Bisgaard Taxon 10/6]|uniref:MFS transporter n=1 Tax=Exercitatus varius TaxID=67857 RepID=A0ABT6ESU2_9PAST|nr:MFS transporter [Exercitatus varius]MDG2939791.1 MFS transporter [Exercitatus varius]MDG2946475.1 MFS transporter [Exercitatus varius]